MKKMREYAGRRCMTLLKLPTEKLYFERLSNNLKKLLYYSCLAGVATVSKVAMLHPRTKLMIIGMGDEWKGIVY